MRRYLVFFLLNTVVFIVAVVCSRKPAVFRDEADRLVPNV